MNGTSGALASAWLRDGIREMVGHTPLVRLRRLFPDAHFELFGKVEGLNPSGSVKDRSAFQILESALARGHLDPNGVVVESSSGNMGIALAQACAYYRIRFVCVTDVRATRQNVAILRAYGAEVEVIGPEDAPGGDLLQARLRRVRELCRVLPGAFCPDQYSNPENVRANAWTMHEIATSLANRVDYLFCATSTCGTLTGCAEYVRSRKLRTTIIAVDAVGSLIFGSAPGVRLIPGLGAARRPDFRGPELTDDYVLVSDLDCIRGCRMLLDREVLLAGGSSGGVVAAIERWAPRIPADACCVAILPDRGERYLDMIYSDDWVREHFGAAGLAEVSGAPPTEEQRQRA